MWRIKLENSLTISSNKTIRLSINYTPKYFVKDKHTFFEELNKHNIFLQKISEDLNNFTEFTRFMTKISHQTPYKCSIYVSKIMSYDDNINNTTFQYPHYTHKAKTGDCDDAALLIGYMLEKAGFKKPLENSHIPTPIKLYDNRTDVLIKKVESLKNEGYAFPLMIGLSRDPLSVPIKDCLFHALCVYQDPSTKELRIIEVYDGLSKAKGKTIKEVCTRYNTEWKRITINQIENGIFIENKPYVLIENSK